MYCLCSARDWTRQAVEYGAVISGENEQITTIPQNHCKVVHITTNNTLLLKHNIYHKHRKSLQEQYLVIWYNIETDFICINPVYWN